MAQNLLPYINDFVENIYLFADYNTIRSTTATVPDKKDYHILAFRHDSMMFAKTGYYYRNLQRHDRDVCEWYYKMMRVLFLGQIQGNNRKETANIECQWFSDNLIGMNFGCHLYISVYGYLVSIRCLSNRQYVQTTFGRVGINDVMPCFKRLTTKKNYRLFIAMRVQIIRNIWGSRDGGRCGGHVNYGGVFQLTEAIIAETNAYESNQEMELSFFGIYVCKNAKLVFVDTCRQCLQKDPINCHHSRTLCQSGTLLIIEGYLCFQFARYFEDFYTARELEDYGIIREGLITKKTTPIFFLRANKECDSHAWYLAPVEHIREVEHWSLLIPESGEFDAIEEYSTGIYEVKYWQSRTPPPWSDIVEIVGYNRPQQFNNYTMPNDSYTRMLARDPREAQINWVNVDNNPPLIPPPKQYTIKPEMMEIENWQILNLPLGTPMRLPLEYRLTGELALHLSDGRFSIYYAINRFWYQRMSNPNEVPLVLGLIPMVEGMPHYLAFRAPIKASHTEQYNVLVYIDQNKVEQHVVSLHWASKLDHLIKKDAFV